MFVKVREYQQGQTMAEYALIMAAVAVVVFVGYQTMGTTITWWRTTVRHYIPSFISSLVHLIRSTEA
jgi:Flp pilus assembly pilin Flp